MLEKWELVTPIISTFLIKDCGMTTMDPAWQITRKCQKENKWSLKNTEKVTRSKLSMVKMFAPNVEVCSVVHTIRFFFFSG